MPQIITPEKLERRRRNNNKMTKTRVSMNYALLQILLVLSSCSSYSLPSSPSSMFGIRSKLIGTSTAIYMSTETETSAAQQQQQIIQTKKTPLPSGLTKETRIGKFEAGHYNKPVVLLGCSGQEHEISKLASSLLPKLDQDANVIELVKKNSIASLEEVEQLLSKHTLNNAVLTLDFNLYEGDDSDEDATAQMTKLANYIHQDLGLLCIYINVHPDHANMSAQGAAKKNALEQDVFIKNTDYEMCIKDEAIKLLQDNSSEEECTNTQSWSDAEWELTRLVSRATLSPPVPGSTEPNINTAHLTMGPHTFFLSLSFPKIEQVKPYLPAMCEDVDAMEFRTDLLDCAKQPTTDRFEILYSHQWLRANCRSHAKRVPVLPMMLSGHVLEDVMPVVYTVRTLHQAGTWPDDEQGIQEMFDLLHLGLRSGVEVLDVESAWDEQRTVEFMDTVEDRYNSQILGSHHVVPHEVSMEEAVGIFTQCQLKSRSHGAKVVLSIEDSSKDSMCHDAGVISSSVARSKHEPIVPNVSLILGEKGQYSRILNTCFTPVTHESLPFVAAPGQLTASEIMTTRILMGLCPPKNYAILGHNIAYSVSPQMHNAAFKTTSLPHVYSRLDVEDVEEIISGEFWNDERFGGLSVTIPHKQNIMPHLDILSDAAKEIGSVNTVIVKDEVIEEVDDELTRVLYGDNTDWIGIHKPISRRMGSSSVEGENKDGQQQRGCALILGGGGTARAAAYAAAKLGLDRIYYNRTPSKAEELANTFGGDVASDLEDGLGSLLDEKNGEIKVVISTLPAAAEFELPAWMLDGSSSRSTKPIIFDVNYKPYNTKLLLQAEKAGCAVVRGSEMLWEQGVSQFELWTGRTAPYKVMKDVVLENCLPKEEDN
mmetsp:Transcript_2423/g.3791  ORF Transcript_2423/g.3791 Transcript_2423/m.3791 type:complete len:879 (-) Transcript_2423:299-2935(-)